MKKKIIYILLIIGALILLYSKINAILATDVSSIIFNEKLKISQGTKVNLDTTMLTFQTETFNRYSIKYTSNIYLKGVITYNINNVKEEERFFLEPTNGKQVTFSSFINGYIDNRIIDKNNIESIYFENIDDNTNSFSINSFELISYQSVDDLITEKSSFIDNDYKEQKTLFMQSNNIKLGVSLKYGGSINYISGNSNIFGNYANINLVNRDDNGRFIQQCYYGNQTYSGKSGEHPYVSGPNDVEGIYNPIQGGSQQNIAPKIVDIKISSDKKTIEVKTKPLLWQVSNEDYMKDYNDYYEGRASDSYMITKYSIHDTYIAVENSYIDFTNNVNNSNNEYSRAEAPATYIIPELDEFYSYYMSKESNVPDSIKKATFGESVENKRHIYNDNGKEAIWSYWGGYFSTISGVSEGIGIYRPDYDAVNQYIRGYKFTDNKNNTSTSFFAPIIHLKEGRIKQFKEVSYDYVITLGNINQVSNIMSKYRSDYSYTLKVDPNGGVCYGSTNPITLNEKLLSYWGNWNRLEVPTRKGYSFLGYYTSDGVQVYNSSGEAANGEYWKVSKGSDGVEEEYQYIGKQDLTVYAQWTDDVSPEIKVTPAQTTVSKNVTVKIKATETLHTSSVYEYQLGANNTTAPTGTWQKYTMGGNVTIGDTLTGNYYLWIREVKDLVGNESTGGKKVGDYHVFGPYVFDNQAPDVAFVTNGNTTYAKSQSTKVTVTEKGTAGLEVLKYQWTQSTTTPSETSFSSTFINGGTITKTDGTGNNWYLWILAKDKLGNTTITKSNEFYLDNTLPTVSITPNGGKYAMPSSGTATIKTTVTATDNGESELNTLEYAWSTDAGTAPNSGWTTFTNGQQITKTDCEVDEYYLWTKVIDKAGNETISKSNAFVVEAILDTENPEIKVSPTQSIVNKNVTVKIEKTEELHASSICEYQLGKNNSTVPTGTWSKYTMGETRTIGDNLTGTYYLWIKEVSDLAGNESMGGIKVGDYHTYGPYVFDNTVPDKKAPTLTATVNSIIATANQTDEHSGIAIETMQYAIKETATSKWSEWITNDSGLHTFAGLKIDTSYDVKTRAKDNVGNGYAESEVSTIITKSITQPIIIPSKTTWTNDKNLKITIEYPELEDAINQYSLDGTKWYEYTGPIQVSENATIYARTILEDGQGDDIITNYKINNIDHEIPKLSEIKNSSNGNWTTEDVKLSWTIDESISGIQKVEYSADGENFIELQEKDWYEITIKGEREETIYVKVTDNAGNISEIKTTEVKIKKEQEKVEEDKDNNEVDKDNTNNEDNKADEENTNGENKGDNNIEKEENEMQTNNNKIDNEDKKDETQSPIRLPYVGSFGYIILLAVIVLIIIAIICFIKTRKFRGI